MAKYTQIPAETFKKLQLNAGVIATAFDTSKGSVTAADIIGATSGGVAFEATTEFTDFGEDIDNCPKNMMELKHIDSWEIKLSGSFVTADTALAKSLIGMADVSGNKVTPRNSVKVSDFQDIWWVGDYSDANDGDNAGYIAIHLMNALSTGGFKVQSTDKAKGTFEFEYTAHFSMENQDTVPYEVFIKAGVETMNAKETGNASK